jgi:hypothetical protein
MANTFELIASYTATGTVATIDFTSIPGTYTDLVLKISSRCNVVGTSQTQKISFNGLTTNLSDRYLFGSGSSAASGTDTFIQLNDSNGTTSTANTFTSNEVYIPNYSSSNNKSVSVDGVMENNATAGYDMLTAGLWSASAAITSITISLSSGSFVQYSTAYLYGVKNA